MPAVRRFWQDSITQTKEPKTMSTEQNTQRPTCAGCGREMIFNVPRMGPAGGYVHADSGKLLCAMEISEQSPPPETGAVDVGVIASSFMKHLDHAPDLREMFAQGMQPLTQRISQLEKEKFTIWSQQQAAEAHVKELEQESGIRLVAAQVNEDRARAAEARIRELEQKLEAALRLTTEQSIDNMRSKV